MLDIFSQGLFPQGVLPYLIGGILIGLSVLIMYVPTGYIPGASRLIGTLASFVSSLADKSHRKMRLIYFFGIVFGAFLFMVLFSSPWQTEVSLWRLAVGGFLVGLGANIGRGCTSGHGICGLGSLAKSSIIYVSIFVVVAIITALIVGVLL